MPTVVRPELELARAVRVTARAGVRDYVLGGAVLAAEWRTMPARPFRGRPVDANEGDETSDQFVHLPPTPQPSSDYRFVHLPYDRLRKQRCRSTKVTMRCICASEGVMGALSTAVNATLFERLNFNFLRDIAPVAAISRNVNEHAAALLRLGVNRKLP
jgi:hypothetical protein